MGSITRSYCGGRYGPAQAGPRSARSGSRSTRGQAPSSSEAFHRGICPSLLRSSPRTCAILSLWPSRSPLLRPIRTTVPPSSVHRNATPNRVNAYGSGGASSIPERLWLPPASTRRRRSRTGQRSRGCERRPIWCRCFWGDRAGQTVLAWRLWGPSSGGYFLVGRGLMV